MKIPLALLGLFVMINGFSQNESEQENKTLIGLRAGLNYSLFRSDQFDVEAGAGPLAGFFIQHKLSKKFLIDASILYSNKGSRSTIPYYKISNKYFEPEILLGIKIFDGFHIHSGITYSHLLSEQMITLDGDEPFGIDKTPIDAFSSELSLSVGIEQRLFEHVQLSLDFNLPRSNTGTRNFSISLKVPLNTKPSKTSYRELKVRASKKQIRELKEGVLCVRLKTSANTIAALRKAGHMNDASRRVEEQFTENQKIMLAFRKHFNFCRVEFFYSDKSLQLVQREWVNIFLNDKLQIDSGISIGPGMQIYTAEFGNLKQDTMQYFSRYSQDFNKNSVPIQFANHYSVSSNIDFDALVIMDRNFVQLNRPFPCYSRFISNSMKQHPEQGLFIFPLLPYLSWSYVDCVEKLDGKLSKYYEKTSKE